MDVGIRKWLSPMGNFVTYCLTAPPAIPIVAASGKKWGEMGLTRLSIHVSRCSKSDPGRQGPDGSSHPVSRRRVRTERGEARRDRRSGSVSPALPLARLGTDRAKAHEPAVAARAGAPAATPDGGPRHRADARRSRTPVAAAGIARVRATRAERNADRPGESLRIVGRRALERAPDAVAVERSGGDRPRGRARVADALAATAEELVVR